MSAFHDSLLKFYGSRRLRYIYLVRDPRDVAMSFMKTPLGDKHYYAITKKWVKLQNQAIHILESTPDLLCLIHYEDLLEDRENTISFIHDFIGDTRFGGVKREASVMSIAPVEQSIEKAKSGWESVKAHVLSQQFKNLCRGESFAKEQLAKWQHPETGLKKDELIIIESMAYEVMDYFEYQTSTVKSPADGMLHSMHYTLFKLQTNVLFSLYIHCIVVHFTDDQIKEFTTLNDAGIDKMYSCLKEENIEDYNLRIHQAEVLKMDAKLLTDPSNWSLNIPRSSF